MSSVFSADITVYGSSISYFTGKLENYFRVKGIAYRFRPMEFPATAKLVREQAGSSQMPALYLGDGRWVTDTTPIIQWFEEQLPEPAVIPIDPVQRFFSLLLEDYADEWLWRPAMHYRWYYDVGARFAGAHLATELTAGRRLPGFLKRYMIVRRQRNGYTTGDGIVVSQVAGVEAIYHRTLAQLEAILSERPFLLGYRPTLADIGFSGPFFRHFALDPVPAEIMRRTAPSVYEWVGRLWNSGPPLAAAELLDGIPQDWGPLLEEIGSHYLPYLGANVKAVSAGAKRFDAQIGGVDYRGARWSPYRVWCLQRLREHFNALDTAEQGVARGLLERHGCWEPLWRHQKLPLDPDLCSGLPFRADAKMIDVYD